MQFLILFRSSMFLKKNFFPTNPFNLKKIVNESPLKMTKNAFYFILKVLLNLKIFNFFLNYGHIEKTA